MYYRLLFLWFFIFATLPTLFSQTRFSPKFGFNFSAMDIEADTIETEGRSGFNIGLDLRIEDQRLFFHPGFHYQQVKADLTKLEKPAAPEALTEEVRINSIKVPLNVGYYLTREGSLLRLHLRGGIVPQFIVSATEREAFNFNKDQLNSFTWGANAAVGIDFILLTVELSYEFGLSNVYQEQPGKNRMAILRFGFIF